MSASGPVRTCVGCRGRADQTELVRLALLDGALVVDGRRRLPGRGAYLHPDPTCWAQATRRRSVARALRLAPARPLALPPFPAL